MGNYVLSTKEQNQEMLAAIGCNSMDDLFSCIPDEAKRKEKLNLPEGKAEMEVKRILSSMAKSNTIFESIFRGAGAYRHYIPSIVKSVTSKEEFLTAYTPYQAEISQGILQSIFEFQTMIASLTGMDASNASVYDGATAAAEAIAMCRERKRSKALVSEGIHPQFMEVIETYCYGNGMEIVKIPLLDGQTDQNYLKNALDDGTACLLMQNPNFYGVFEEAEEVGKIVHEAGAKYILAVNPTSLALVKSPGECEADIAVGEGQPLGLPLSFGGPYLGFMACSQDMLRKLPGRIAGQTVDVHGNRAFVLTLQAREQHIRREKASSNICSNQAFCAMTAASYLAAMGESGLHQAALQSMSKAVYLEKELNQIGFASVFQKEHFHEFVTTSPIPVSEVMQRLERKGILGGLPLSGAHEGHILWCCTEVNTRAEIDLLISCLKEVL
ncbi:MAG: aminomethyl-transferring glycine dehydrogenase subunit GcvPA [Lachnospiraceae bacterium]